MMVRALALLGLLSAIASLPVGARAQTESIFERADQLRRRGDDQGAARLLAATAEEAPSPRARAELGLAYQGLERWADAEQALAGALATTDDPWVQRHRAGLEAALRFARSRLGWLSILSNVPGARVTIDGAEHGELPLSAPLRLAEGEVQVAVAASGRTTVTQSVRVVAGQTATATLDPALGTCPHESMVRPTLAAASACCWPGQTWSPETSACEGAPLCPAGFAPSASACMAETGGHDEVFAEPRRSHPTGFRLVLRSGPTNFFKPNTGLFREGAYAQDRATNVGPRVELRVGGRLSRFFSIDLTAAGMTQSVANWYENDRGVTPGINTQMTLYGYEAGFDFNLHTSRARRAGAIDFHMGVGVRPLAVVYLDSDVAFQDTAVIRAVTFPVEAGFSFFMTRAMAFDVGFQLTPWMPREYCGESSDGVDYCLGLSDMNVEISYALLAGFSFLL